MSKRFGRNQKRRMREEAESLKEAHRMTNELLAHTGRNLREKVDEIETAKRYLSPHFAGLEPKRMEFRHLDDRAMLRLPLSGPYSMEEAGALTPETMRHVPLHVMAARAESESLRDMVHLRVTLANEQVGYAISRRALTDAPEKELVQTLAREMAPVLLQAIRKRR